MNNTIIQEKVKEFEKKFIKEAQTCDKADCDNELAMGCQNPNHQIRYKYLNGGYEDVKNFLEQALTSLVKEVREEERESEADHIWSGMIRALNNQMMTYQDLYNYISLMTGVDLKKIHKKRFPNRADLKSK